MVSDFELKSGHSGYYVMTLWILFEPFVLTFSDTASAGDGRVPPVTAPSGCKSRFPTQTRLTLDTLQLGGGGCLAPQEASTDTSLAEGT